MTTQHSQLNRLLNTVEAGRVIRYHAAPTVQPQTVGLHSWGVAVLALHITGGSASGGLLRECLMHDSAELFTGDAPFTAKRDNPALKDLHDWMDMEHRNCDLIPASAVAAVCRLDPHDTAILKICDTLEGLLWCRKTEFGFGKVVDRWVVAYSRCQEKFSGIVPIEEFSRADELFNELLASQTNQLDPV